MAPTDETQVKGMGMDAARAEEGMKLFKTEEEAVYDTDAASKFKEEQDAKIAQLQIEASALTGKDNKKARQEKEKEAKALKDAKEYIDACKVVKGMKPPNGNFVQKAAGPSKEQIEADKKAAEEKAAAEAAKAAEEAKKAEEAKAKKEPKKVESAGISKAERDELEKLKNDIIAKKKMLKEQGMSGGQMNKDEEIVTWVKRMNELKEKENPGMLAAQQEEKKGGKKKKVLDSESQAKLAEKEKALEEYLEKLRTEFKYTKKEIAADPDYCDMKAELEKMKK